MFDTHAHECTHTRSSLCVLFVLFTVKAHVKHEVSRERMKEGREKERRRER